MMSEAETIQVLHKKIDEYKAHALTLIAEIERLRAREASARVCQWCMDVGWDYVAPKDGCTNCEGKGIVYDGA